MKTQLFLFLILTAFFCYNTETDSAVNVSNPRAIGLGGAYIGLAEGAEAPHWNPANLALRDERFFSMNFLSLGMGFHNNSFSKHQYDIYNGQKLDLDDIINSIPDGGLNVDMTGAVEILGIGFGNYAFTISGVAPAWAKINKDIPRLIKGNEIGRKYNFGGSDGRGLAYISYAFSGALPIEIDWFKRFAVGANLKYLQGLFGAELVKLNGDLLTNDAAIIGNINGTARMAQGGNGISFDLGAMAIVNEQWTVGLSFTDLLNTISWSNKPEEIQFSALIDSINLDRWTEYEEIDSLFKRQDTTLTTGSFSMGLPQQMRIGAVYRAEKFFVSMDYIQGFRNGPGATTMPQIAGGIEYKPLFWLPLRAGLALGGKEQVIIALGLGFHAGRVRIDLAATSQGSILPANRQGSTLAFGVRLLQF